MVSAQFRGVDLTRTTSPSGQTLREAVLPHGFCFTIHVLLSAAALFTGHMRGAVWILLPGVLLHLYPVLLQRAVMLRSGLCWRSRCASVRRRQGYRVAL